MSDIDAPPAAPPDGGDDGGGGGGIGGGDAAPAVVLSPKDPGMYLPIYIMTGVYGAIFLIVPYLIRKGPNQGLIRCCIWIATFSFWALWFTVYVAQMNPLMGPRIKNTTMCWLAHAWGKSASEAPPAAAPAPPAGGAPAPEPEPEP